MNMKRLILIAGLGLGLMNVSFAQDDNEGEKPDTQDRMEAVKNCKEKPTEDEQSKCILDLLRGYSAEKPIE